MPRLERLEHRVLRASRGGQPQQGRGLAQLQDEQGGHAGISQKVIELGHEIGRLLYFLTFVFNENNAFTKKTIQLK